MGRYRIRFNYTPDDDYTVKAWYYYMPADVTADVVPVVSAIGFTECLLWAAAMIALQPKDPEGYATAAANYERAMQDFRAYRPAAPDYTPVLRPMSNDGSIRRGPSLGPFFPAT